MPIQIGGKKDHDFNDPLGVLCDCHERIEHFLEVLLVVTELNMGRPLSPSHQHALRTGLDYFLHAAPNHTLDEEESLFPRLDASDNPRAVACREKLPGLIADHRHAAAQHQEAHRLIQTWLNAAALDPAAAERLLALLTDLREMYRRHIREESGCVFRIAGQCLRPPDLDQIGTEMARRRGIQRPVP